MFSMPQCHASIISSRVLSCRRLRAMQSVLRGRAIRCQPLGVAGSIRHFAADPGAGFDVFAKLKDPPDEADGAASKKRKPSDRVLRLVDEIMSLTLIEAADLCDLCQERLAPGDGMPVPGRMAFPHPMGMFPGAMPMGMGMPGAAPMPGPAAAAPAAAPAAAAPAAAAEEAAETEDAPKKKEEPKKKENVSIKLVSFETAKKISVVKEVRAVTQLGLKESKEFVESAPKVIKKGVPIAEAEALMAKLVAAGAEIALE